jgi:hypothetical protein
VFTEDCPFKVVRTNSGDEVLARAANLLIGRAAFETAKRMYPKDLIEYRRGAQGARTKRTEIAGLVSRWPPVQSQHRANLWGVAAADRSLAWSG